MRALRFPRVLGVVAVFYLVGMAVVFALLSVQSSQFSQQARETEGTVVALVERAPLGSTRQPGAESRAASLAPRVRYTVDGKTFEYTAAHGRYRQRLRVGDHVTVLYAPGDPQSARLRAEGRVLGPLITIGFGLGALAVVALLVKTRRRTGGLPTSRGPVPGRDARSRRVPS